MTNAQGSFDYHNPGSFSFGDPVLKYNLKKISFTQNKDSVKYSFDTTGLPLRFILKPATTLMSDSTYKLVLLPGAFTDMFGHTNDTLKLKFQVLEQAYFGSLKLNVNFSTKGHYIVQLLNDKNGVYRQFIISGTQTIFMDAIIPGTYRIRVIDDVNNNRVWDTGNFIQSLQPEKVYYYNQSLNIRSNWDLTQSWDVK